MLFRCSFKVWPQGRLQVWLQASLLATTAIVSTAQPDPLQDTVNAKRDTVTTREVRVQADAPTISSAPLRTEVVTRKELTRAACCSLAESFERSPSVEVSFTDAVSGARAIRMLGLGGQYTQLLTDAVPLMLSLEIPFGLDHVPGPFMDNISIAKGAATVTNGYEGMTGQINICMLDPLVTEEPFYLNAYGNTFGRAELNLYGAQHLSDALSTITMLHGRILDREIDGNGDGFLDTPRFRQLNAVNKWHYNDDETEWQFFVHGIVDGYQSGNTSTAAVRDQRYRTTTDIERLESYAKYGLLDVLEDLDQSSVAVIVSGAIHTMASQFGQRSVDARERTLQGKAVFAATLWEGFQLNTGVSYRWDQVRETLRTDTVDRSTSTTTLARTESVPGMYAEATWAPVKPLTIVAGLRSDWHNQFGARLTPRMHVKWQVASLTSVRASAGSGWRVPSAITENLSSFINSRTLHLDPLFRPEQAVNYGASVTTSFSVADRPIVVDAEVYHTEFSNRVVVDFDRSVRHLWVANLDGRSYSTSIMMQIQASPIPRMDIGLAYRWLDVQAPYNGTLQLAPMLSRDRVLLTFAWETQGAEWQVDGTVSYNGSGRLPTTLGNPMEYSMMETFPGYWRATAQITRRFPGFDVYLGGENLNGFVQQDPVIAAEDPFSRYFDASMAWGPTSPRMVYLGVRWRADAF